MSFVGFEWYNIICIAFSLDIPLENNNNHVDNNDSII